MGLLGLAALPVSMGSPSDNQEIWQWFPDAKPPMRQEILGPERPPAGRGCVHGTGAQHITQNMLGRYYTCMECLLGKVVAQCEITKTIVTKVYKRKLVNLIKRVLNLM